MRGLSKSRFKVGDYVRYPPETRPWIVLEVSLADLRTGCNADRPGVYAFWGQWYGKGCISRRSYGKIRPVNRVGVVRSKKRLAWKPRRYPRRIVQSRWRGLISYLIGGAT